MRIGKNAATALVAALVVGASLAEQPMAATSSAGAPIRAWNTHFQAQAPNMIMRASFEDGEHSPCEVTPDLDGDGLVDAGCSPAFVPPDPVSIAPPVDSTAVQPFPELYDFLYRGLNPVQRGVLDGVVEPHRMAVLRGRVVDEAGQPLSGVLVRVSREPGLGYTYSRADGQYDMVVNAARAVVLDYQAPGYARAQRQVADVPWRDFKTVPDLALVTLDATSTQIVLGPDKLAQVARGATVSDPDGTRRATAVLPAGLEANLVKYDGTSIPLSQLHLRLTEFTTGAYGEARMPALLTPTTAYTYAVDISADEAIAANAATIQFSETVAFYVENFLDFPVGGAVPVGYYDYTRQAWVPQANGRIVRVLGVTGLLADLDVDGNGVPATEAQYDALAVTDAEREYVAQMYSPNQELWRVPLKHLSTYDFNWPDVPPADATVPEPQESDSKKDKKEDKSPPCQGSIIECENQTLGELIPIAGTSMSLNYRSDAQAGRSGAYESEIVDTKGALPASVKRIDVTTTIAGQTAHASYPVTADLHVPVAWNGNDAYGRRVSGARTMGVQITYVYDGNYAEPATMPISFGATSYSGVLLGGSATRGEINLSKVMQIQLGDVDRHDTMQIGGWSLSSQEVFDATAGAIVHGAGERSSVDNVFPAISQYMGQRFQRGDAITDGTPAAITRFDEVSDIDTMSDGSLIIADLNFYTVYRIGEDGILHRILGGHGCDEVTCGNQEVPALQFALSLPYSVSSTPDGCAYVWSYFGSKSWITRVCNGLAKVIWQGPKAALGRLAGTPWNTVYMATNSGREIYELDPALDRLQAPRKVAGSAASSTYSGDDGPALSAGIAVSDLTIAADGTVYFGDVRGAVRKIGPDGIIRRVAGRPQGCVTCTGYSGDGGPATDALLTQVGQIALARDGSLLFGLGGIVRRIDPKGTISTFAGIASGNAALCQSSPTSAGCLIGSYATGLAIGSVLGIASRPDGSAFIVGNDYVMYRIAPTLPGSSSGNVTISDTSGAVAHRFTPEGRHLQVVNTITGAVLQSTGYDSAGRIVGVVDAYGNALVVERDASGKPTALVAQDGERTTLEVDAATNLVTVTSPENQVWSMTYGGGGLLQTLTDPRGNMHQFGFDDAGRLSTDSNPALGGWNVVRTDLPAGRRIEMTTALGRTVRHDVVSRPAGGRDRITTKPDGAVSIMTVLPDGQTDATGPDGLHVQTLAQPDPRFGMRAPTHDVVVTTPGALQLKTSTRRAVTLAQPDDPLSLLTLTETSQVNSRQYTQTYAAANHTATMTTPMGRTSQVVTNDQGQPISVAIPGLAPIEYTYDTRGRLTQIVAGSSAEQRVTTIGFDANGYVDTLVDSADRTVLLDNDKVGRTTTQTLPDSRQIGFAYNKNSDITGITPPSRPVHGFEYTPVDLVSKYSPPPLPGIATPETTFEYDVDRRLQKVTRPDGLVIDPEYNGVTGRLDHIVAPSGNYLYNYLVGGRTNTVTAPGNEALAYTWDGPLLTGVAWSGPVSGSVAYGYDNNFWLEHLTSGTSASGNTVVDYGYDNDGLLTSAQQGATTLTLSRNAQNGLLTGTALGNVTDSWSYNSFAEPTQYAASYNGAERFKALFERDRLGRITKKTETIGGITTVYDYTYDPAGRLDTVKHNGVLQADYSYDANGNRLGAALAPSAVPSTGCGAGLANPTGTVDAQDRLTAYGNCTFTYTANGDLTSKTDTTTNETTHYQYDVFGNLRHVDLSNGDQIDYVIDGQNRRVGKKINGTLIQSFLYLNQLKPLAELDGAGNVTATFVYADRPNTPTYMIRSGHVYRLVSDYLGSPRLIVDVADGSVAQRIDYDPWGQVLGDSSPGFQPFGFTGGVFDRSTGMVALGSRDYLGEVGRWTLKDPLGVPGPSTLVYEYVDGDPINLVDRSGYWSTGAHNFLLEHFFGYLDPSVLTAIEEGSASVDGILGGLQSEEFSFMHAMTAPGQSKHDACNKMNRFIENQITQFRNALGRAKMFKANGDAYWADAATLAAAQFLGAALHPVMDSTSPAHGGFQTWSAGEAMRHGPWPWSEENTAVLRSRPDLLAETLRRMNDAMAGRLMDCDCLE